MNEALFVVRAPLWWAAAYAAGATVLGVFLWRRVALDVRESLRLPARVGAVAFAFALAVLGAASTRHGVEAFDDHLVVTPRFATASTYRAEQVRFYEEVTISAGIGRQNRLEPAIGLGFADDTEIQLPLRYRNVTRLRAWLAERGVHERSPFERPSARP